MKRSRLLLLSAALVPLLAGCSKPGGPFADAKPLIIGTDATYPPFETVDERGQLAGVSIDMGRALGDYLKRPVEFNNMSFEGLMTALKSGSVDIIISSMTASEERRKSIDFSDPYVKTGLAVLVSSKSSVKTEDDLKKPGCKLVVRIGTTGESYVHDFLPKASVTALDSDVACVQEVVNGNVDAWIYDQLSLMRFHQQQPDTTRVLLKPLREEFWAIGLRQGDDALRKKINGFLKDFRANGGFKKLADKHLAKERAMMEAQHIPFVFDL
jgi:polar amino acid transport system substrate-binding protein